MGNRSFFNALHDREGDFLLATVLEGPAQGERVLLRNTAPVWPEKLPAFWGKHLPALAAVTSSGILKSAGQRIFVERFGAAPQLVGLPVTALEDRPEFAEELRQAGADAVLCLPFAEGLAQIPGGQETYFVVVTRAHSCDIACLRSILQKPAAYVGMMGSRKRAALVHTQLAELGLPQERIDALHAPIGLSIGAKTAQEIALSILAEIVSVKNSRQQTEGFSPALLAALEQQTAPAVLATIVGRHGSTPREEGSKMLVLPDGSAVGSVGGLNYLVLGFVNGIACGFSIPISWTFGAKDYREMRRYPVQAGRLYHRGGQRCRGHCGLRRLHGSLFAASGTGGMSHEA